ncbi:MAG TPA: response regulator [Stellaceae bacterium]|jgi:two-component system response regulator|nr:response regulator [Stellaceae bacterium]
MSDAGPTLLLVEDNPDDAELARRAFARCDLPHRLVWASDGEEALDYLFATGAHAGRDKQELPRAVLLDLKLPKLSGHEVLRRIRAEDATRRVPVIILTTSREERDIATSYDLGANSYVRKPVNFTQFVDAARQLGLYWLALNEPAPEDGRQP